MASFSSNLRSSCSLPNLILTSVNLLLLLLSSASFAPLLLLRAPPSPFGWALFAVSLTTLLSSLLGSYSHLTTHYHSLFVAHISLLIVSSVGQALAFFSLFLCSDSSLRFLESDNRLSRVLMRIEECAMVGMFVLGSMVLVLECVVESWWVREFEDAEAAAAAAQRKKKMKKGLKGLSQRTTRVRVESVVESSGEMDERMKGKCEEECVMNEV